MRSNVIVRRPARAQNIQTILDVILQIIGVIVGMLGIISQITQVFGSDNA